MKPIRIACRCLGVILVSRRASSFTLANKEVFYQNCEIFNNSDIYDGPICGSDGVTYANSIYLDCVNYQMFQNGKQQMKFPLFAILNSVPRKITRVWVTRNLNIHRARTRPVHEFLIPRNTVLLTVPYLLSEAA